MRMKTTDRRLHIVIVLTACWVVAMPPVWMQAQLLSSYVPELVIAGACLILLPGAWLHRRWAARGLVVAAFVLPALKAWWLGSPDAGTWLISSALLILVAWGSAERHEDQPGIPDATSEPLEN